MFCPASHAGLLNSSPERALPGESMAQHLDVLSIRRLDFGLLLDVLHLFLDAVDESFHVDDGSRD